MRYALLNIRRNVAKCMVMVAAVLIFSTLITALDVALQRQRDEVSNIMTNLPIEAVVSDIYGTTFDGLSIMPAYIDLLYNENSLLAPFIKDPCIKRSIPCQLSNAQGDPLMNTDVVKLIGITSLEADPLLREENGVSIYYQVGNNDEVFLSSEMVCLVSSAILDRIGSETDIVYLSFEQAVYERRQEIKRASMAKEPLPGGEDVGLIRLSIVGVIDGGIADAIYCPWTLIRGIDEAIYGNATANSMSFTIRDNQRLNEAKTLLRGYFSEVTPGYPSQTSAFTATALTIRDGDLVRSVSPLERSIAFLSSALPFLLILSIGIGFLASNLYTRSRRVEFAIMRSLGTKHSWIFASVFLEQFILCLVGVGLVLCLLSIVQGIAPQLFVYLIFVFLCYLAGAAISVGRLTSVNVMSAMKAKE